MRKYIIPREFLSAVERVLCEYPVRRKQVMSDWLETHLRMIEEGLKLLAEDEREVVEMFCWQGLKGWEVAELMSMDERSVWRIKARALGKLTPVLLPHVVES